MKKLFKHARFLALLLSAVLVIQSVPAPVLAAGLSGNDITAETVQQEESQIDQISLDGAEETQTGEPVSEPAGEPVSEEASSESVPQETESEAVTEESSSEESSSEEIPQETESEAITEESSSEEVVSEEATSESAVEEETEVETEEKKKLPLFTSVKQVLSAAEAGKSESKSYEDCTVVIAGSDFQARGGNAAGAEIVNGLIGKINERYPSDSIDGFLFAGDYSVNATKASDVKYFENTIKTAYPGLTDETLVMIQGNHDNSVEYSGAEAGLVGTVIDISGAHDAEDYGVYVINEQDYMWRNSNESTIKNTASNLEKYLNSKRNDGYTKPVFVVSHLPLHYCMRTRNDGDGMYANYIFDVLNEAGNAGLNIIFLFGHNHSHGWDDYLGGASIFLTEGDKINIAQSSKTNFKEETLAFTYMNAGYVGYYGDSYTSTVDKSLTMTAFEITDTDVIISRYDSNDIYDLKSAGVYNVEYPDSAYYTTNIDTVASPYTLSLSKEITPAEGETTDPDNGNTGTGTTTERTYTRVTATSELVSSDKYLIFYNGSYFMLPEVVEKSDNGTRKGFNIESTTICGSDIITGDYQDKEWILTESDNGWLLGNGVQYAKLTDTSDYKVTATLEESGDVFTIGGSENAFTFSNDTYVLNYNDRGLINGYANNAATFYIYRMTAEADSGADSTDQNVMVTKDGVSVKAPGLTDLAVAVERKSVEGYSTYVSYDIAPEGYTQGDEAEVTIALNMNWFSASRPVEIIDAERGTSKTVDIVGGIVTFTTNHFSVYNVGQVRASANVESMGNVWVQVQEKVEKTDTTYSYTLDTNAVDDNSPYLIVGANDPQAMGNGTLNSVGITINGNTASVSNRNYEWEITSEGKITDGTNYLKLSANKNGKKASLSLTTNENEATKWNITKKNDGYRVSGTYVYATYYLRYDSNMFSVSSNKKEIRLYGNPQEIAGNPGQDALYVGISGKLTYNVEIGTTKADIIAAVQDGIDVYTSTTDVVEVTNGTKYSDNGPGMTWSLDESYDGVTLGEYAVTIAYNGITVGIAEIVVSPVEVSSYTIDPKSANVYRGAAQSLVTGSQITVMLADGTNYTVPVTISMLSKNGQPISTANVGSQSGLTVIYNNVVITDEFTLNVQEKIYNNYPEYPNEGAVLVEKTATGIDFQASGIAQVELSVSGVPSHKGADVVVVIDTSSSMKDNKVGSTDKSRIEILSESLEQMLVQFQTPNKHGGQPDISVAIIDFNGYYNNTEEAFDQISLTHSNRSNVDNAKIFTGDNKGKYIKNVGLSAKDFVDVTSLNAAQIAGMFNDDTCASGTNYDGALENAYNLLAAKQNANGNEERDSYVIFLSDGAPFRYNGFNNGSTKSTYNTWNSWLNGSWEIDKSVEHSEFYNASNGLHYHRYAEAIKGNVGELYQVIDRNETDATPKYMKNVSGLGASIYAIGFGLADDGDNNGKVTVATQQELIQVISSGEGYNYPNVQSKEELVEAFTKIAVDINYAANNAVFNDQMGESFNIQLVPLNYKSQNNFAYDRTITPKIEIRSYDIWTRTEYLDGDCTEDMIGQRKVDGDGKNIYTVIETVTFTSDKTVVTDKNNVQQEVYSLTGAYSDKVDNGATNILGSDGVIYAKNFVYNTTDSDVTVNGKNVAAESFYWDIGTVTTTELALNYYVYLEGALEGKCESGSYATNNYATLTYTNYLGNESSKDTVSPSIAWEAASVHYAFYLVNSEGKPVNANGEVVSFAYKTAVTQPVKYDEVLLNSIDDQATINVTGLTNLPEGYTIYDEDATYTVYIFSNATGAWEIEKGKSVSSTYVMDFSDTVQFSNELRSNSAGNPDYDYTATTVWFAVVWNPKCVPDTVVIDYGLPVDIHVLHNDMFGDYGNLVGISNQDSVKGSVTGDADNQIGGFEATGSYGTATVRNTDSNGNPLDPAEHVIRYTPSCMTMSGYDRFSYSVKYAGAANSGYYYGTMTVIPATSIYYEDDYITLTTETKGTSGWATNEKSGWISVGQSVDKMQDEDRVGEYSLPNVDANNLYGYDSAYTNMSEYSLGSAAKVNVRSGNRARATFEFYGTGFDVISLTSNTTGSITVNVFAWKDNAYDMTRPHVSYAVDTYYGYARKTDAEGKTVWEPVDNNSPNALYQVPVMKVENLTYGKYKVQIVAAYSSVFDHKQYDNASYDFYLDAIRIYNPAGDYVSDIKDNIVKNAYMTDGELYPNYFELRDWIIDAKTFDTLSDDTVSGVVFIDSATTQGAGNTNSIADYRSYGPNNELYLTPGQAVSFLLNAGAVEKPVGYDVDTVQLAIKTVGGNGTVKIWDAASATVDNATTRTISTSTDLYYDISNLNGKNVVILNSGSTNDAIVSITNIKVTYKAVEASTGISDQTDTIFRVSRKSAGMALMSMRPSDMEEELPEGNVPEENETEIVVPEETESETIIPEETESETVIPEETESETVILEETESETVIPEETESETVIPEETESETSIPEETESETIVPEETESETIIPEETESETIVPEETESETVIPEETIPEKDSYVDVIVNIIVKAVKKLVKKLFGWLFG